MNITTTTLTKAPKSRIKWMSVNQINKFFDAIDRYENICLAGGYDPVKYKAVFTTMYFYGLRVSEAVNLDVEHLHFDSNKIFIMRAKGSISKAYPLLPQVRDAIETWMRKRFRYTLDQGGPLFVSGRDKRAKRLTHGAVRYMFKQLTELAGIKGYSTHSLRHSIAVHLLNDCASIHEVQDLLGHKSIANTALYAQIVDKGRDAYFKAFEKSIKRGGVAGKKYLETEKNS